MSLRSFGVLAKIGAIDSELAEAMGAGNTVPINTEATVSRFTKSEGLTTSERYLAQLCGRSFLSLWSYPNIFRQPGKELCDHLVVFREHVIIFSDKSCQFPDSGDLIRDWGRWFKRAVQHSAEQVYGAERWLRNHPDRLFMDARCTQPFPLSLPREDDVRYHRIVVASNASERCRQFFNNSGTGSIMLRSDIMGAEHYSNPFTVGQVDANRGYVHVFDDVTLNIILRELDTISDFTNYLTRKEAVVRSSKVFGAAGEEDVLAHYLTELNEAGDHDIVLPLEADAVWFTEGAWASMSADPRYTAKKSADRQSYAWDELIEKFLTHITGGTLATGNDLPLADHERGVRVMAGEPRLLRRSLTAALFDLLGTTPVGHATTRLVLCKQTPGRAYQFYICPQDKKEPYERYRERRNSVLAAYCYVAKVKRPELNDIIGIATEPVDVQRRSEDLVYLDARQWSQADQTRALELQETTGILVNPRETAFHDNEYPKRPIVFPKSPPPSNRPIGNRQRRRAMQAWARRAKS